VGRLIRFDAMARVRSRSTSPSNESLDTGGDDQILSEEEFNKIQFSLLSPLASQKKRKLESTPRVEVERFVPSIRDHSMDEYLNELVLNIPK